MSQINTMKSQRTYTLPAAPPAVEALLSGHWRALLSQAYLVGLPTTRGLWERADDAIPTDLTEIQVSE